MLDSNPFFLACLFVHLFIKYLLEPCYLPGTVFILVLHKERNNTECLPLVLSHVSLRSYQTTQSYLLILHNLLSDSFSKSFVQFLYLCLSPSPTPSPPPSLTYTPNLAKDYFLSVSHLQLVRTWPYGINGVPFLWI